MRLGIPFTLATLFAALLTGCGSPPKAQVLDTPTPTATDSRGYLSLPDRAAFLQTDPRWAGDKLGRSSDTMGTDGCLVTAVAMAAANLGVGTDPKRLNRALTEANAFTPNGWLVWSGVEVATGGRVSAVYHDEVDPAAIRSCMRDGQYPLVRFRLPSGRSHWAMIVAESPLDSGKVGYRMRDPLRASSSPLIFPRGADAFRALRCVGPGPEARRVAERKG